MSEPLLVAITDALRTHLETPTLGVEIAYPFVPFTPTSPTAYLQIHALLPAEPDAYSVDFIGGGIVYRGVFQVDAVIPDNTAEAPGRRLAALVAARFARGTILQADGFLVKVTRPPVEAPPLKDETWVHFPVSVPWQVSPL